ILIMWLEPIAKGAPQHALFAAWRPALHHVVLAVEEICGIALVERERPETGKGFKGARCPFPSIRQQALCTECASGGGKSVDRRRVPSLEIKVSMPRGRPFSAPRKVSL